MAGGMIWSGGVVRFRLAFVVGQRRRVRREREGAGAKFWNDRI